MKLTEIINKIHANKENLEFLPTGFAYLDKELDGGFMRKELIVLGGSTGIGKSYLAGQMFSNIAKAGFKSAYFSLEISNEMVVSRLIGQQANIKSTHVLTGNLDMTDSVSFNTHMSEISVYEEFMNFYDETYRFEEIKKEIIEQGYEFVVVDFIQNVVELGMDEYTRLSYVALELQKLAKASNSTILVLSQLSNMMARDKSNSTVEYKGSGSIATVADLGFYITRGDFDINPDDLFLMLRKNRRGVSGQQFNLKFERPGGKIDEKPQEDII